MAETPFYKTRMGQRFFERIMPELVKQLERLNDTLQRLADDGEKHTKARSDGR